jgi:surfeit locus 1 family protein
MLLFAAICLVLAGTFVQLGRWQLDRRAERRGVNLVVAARAAESPVSILDVAGDTTARYRPATVRGVAEYDRELVLAARGRGGSPGVHLLTPVRLEGRDERVLVNRGWVYSPDAVSVERERWREGDTVSFSGWVEHFSPPGDERGSPTLERPMTLRFADRDAAARTAGVPLLPVYLVATEPRDSAGGVAPARLTLPDLGDEGPHLSYAGQWFAFSLIALAGAGIGLSRARRRSSEEAPEAGGSNGAIYRADHV